ncbi:hypothetical protein PENSPDRAFT_745165 [Peniophora sp. CONT]|nr:hypothetical protein PENSPDRAFT_745165 [Peniophora sp. CONT]
MVIIDEKMAAAHRPLPQPPPPYRPARRSTYDADSVPPPPFASYSRPAPKLSALPPHLLLHILYQTFPQRPEFESGTVVRQRRTLYWLSMELRRVSRSFYIACMHILRSSYLPAYSELVKYPYTSDPFPLAATPPTDASSLTNDPVLPSLQRETAVLDLFIALKVREDVWADDSELHLERDESFRDLFDLLQPRARTEDLLRVYGERSGFISSKLNGTGGKNSRKAMLDFASLAVSFNSRRVGIIVTAQGRKRTVVDTARSRDESLEAAAQRLTMSLGDWWRGAERLVS